MYTYFAYYLTSRLALLNFENNVVYIIQRLINIFKVIKFVVLIVKNSSLLSYYKLLNMFFLIFCKI